MNHRLEAIPSTPVMSLLVGQFVVFGAIWPTLPVSPNVSMRYAIFGVAIAFCLTLLQKAQGSFRVLIIGVGFALSITLIPMLFKGYDSTLLMIILSVMLGYLTYYYYIPPQINLFYIGFLTIYIFAYYISNGALDSIFESVDDSGGLSRNFIGILLIQQYLVYYAICIRNSIEPRHWPLFVIPIIAVIASGVGSALAALMAIIGYLFIELKMRFIRGVFASLCVGVVAYALNDWFFESTLFYRISGAEFVGGRSLLWIDFAERLQGQAIWIGLPKESLFLDHNIKMSYTHNLHNSYFNLYSSIGVFSLFYLSIISYTAIALFRRNAMLGWLFVCALVRAGSDGYFFKTFLVDFVLIFLFFLTPLGERLLCGYSGRKIHKVFNLIALRDT